MILLYLSHHEQYDSAFLLLIAVEKPNAHDVTLHAVVFQQEESCLHLKRISMFFLPFLSPLFFGHRYVTHVAIWYLPLSSLKYNCMQSSSSSCSLFINILSRITFIMNIGKHVNTFCMQKKHDGYWFTSQGLGFATAVSSKKVESHYFMSGQVLTHKTGSIKQVLPLNRLLTNLLGKSNALPDQLRQNMSLSEIKRRFFNLLILI